MDEIRFYVRGNVFSDPVQDLAIVPEGEARVNDQIMCSASGNPEPVVTLTVEEGEPIVAEGTASFPVTEELKGEVVTVTCSARNEVDSEPTQLEAVEEITILGKGRRLELYRWQCLCPPDR